MNELALLVTGIYGHPLPKQYGVPIRLVVPRKYGVNSIGYIVSMEFSADKPRLFGISWSRMNTLWLRTRTLQLLIPDGRKLRKGS